MAIKTKLGYICSYCRQVYPTDAKADACRNKHDLIYLALSKEDLNKLAQFIFSKDDTLITEGLYNAVQSGLKRAAIGKLDYE